jgi:cytoskeletal protein RodZ
MPSTKTEGSPRTSKTVASKQVQAQTPSESEEQTQKLMEKTMTPSPEKNVKVDRLKKIGEVTITFFSKRHHEVKVTGEVAFSHIQHANRALYKAVSINKAKMRQVRRAKIAAKTKEK